MKRTLFLLPLLTLALLAPPALAADGEIVVKAGTVAPDGTPWSELLKRMKRRFKKDSEKRIKLKAYLGGRLGGDGDDGPGAVGARGAVPVRERRRGGLRPR